MKVVIRGNVIVIPTYLKKQGRSKQSNFISKRIWKRRQLDIEMEDVQGTRHVGRGRSVHVPSRPAPLHVLAARKLSEPCALAIVRRIHHTGMIHQ